MFVYTLPGFCLGSIKKKTMDNNQAGEIQNSLPDFNQKPGTDFYTDMVADFHRVHGHPVRAFPTLPDRETAERRLNLIFEELHELSDAMQKGRIEDIAKELFDLFYVVAGTAIELGLHNKSYFLFSAVHASNMSKTTTLSRALLDATRHEEDTGDACDVLPTADKEQYSIIRKRDGKVIKPSSYRPAEGMVRAILESKASNIDLE